MFFCFFHIILKLSLSQFFFVKSDHSIPKNLKSLFFTHESTNLTVKNGINHGKKNKRCREIVSLATPLFSINDYPCFLLKTN